MKKTYIITTVCIALLIMVGSYIVSNNSQTSSTSLLSGHEITVHKTPTCGCCGNYVDYLEKHGANVTVKEHLNLTTERKNRSIPTSLESCHFSEIDGYVVEGHVPVEAMIKLVNEKPDISGIALPGMPAGSPGMGGTKLTPFAIQQFTENGETDLYTTL